MGLVRLGWVISIVGDLPIVGDDSPRRCERPPVGKFRLG